MRMTSKHLLLAVTSVTLFVSGAACDPAEPNARTASTAQPDPVPPAKKETSQADEEKKLLDARKLDYGEALRTASLKLRDRLPDLAEIKQIEQAAPDDNAKRLVYEKLIDDMIASAEFSRTMIKFFRDTFRIGQVGDIQANVNKDAAPTFAAQLVIEGRSYNELFTATDNTCPSYDNDANTFTPAACPLPSDGIAGPTVGILTDPGLQGQYFANMAFRRARFVQETFVCSKFPAEYAATPTPMGAGTYTGTQPFTSITGKQNKADAKIDFQDTKATICANCHSTLNHIAFLFANYDQNGALRDSPQVKVPVPGEPAAQRIDFLPDGESFAWRLGKPVTDIASLGQAIAADPDVPRCAVNRVWNYAMSRGDIVNDFATVPKGVTQPYVDSFVASGMKLKETIRAVFKSEDFTKF